MDRLLNRIKDWLLLIAPVWNWNKSRHAWKGATVALLIAPVWNWNLASQPACIHAGFPFNRTSLELKLSIASASSSCFLLLLIAPVWNWNLCAGGVCGHDRVSFNRTSLELKPLDRHNLPPPRMLLIAPVWNWNAKVEARIQIDTWLLIAPVWNWNRDSWVHSRWTSPFNRTSLELKRVIPLPFCPAVFATFNRTSLELKPFCRSLETVSTR